MTRVRAATLAVCLALQSCAGMSNSLGNSANSSGNSANSSGNSGGSSGQSGNSSGQSANSSGQSNASSQNSSASSAASSDTSKNSATSVESSQATTAATSNAPSSSIVLGSALLLGVSGGILSTVLTAKHRREAKLERERLKELQLQQQPQPMPYKVEPIPLTPPPPPPPTPPAEPPAPAPKPKPKRSELIEEGPTLDAMVMARSWLLANQLQLSQDLALGAGPTIDDLAGITGIAPEHRERFGRVLQKNRSVFTFSREVTPQEAAQVMSRVGDLMVADPILRGSVASLSAR